MNRGEQNRVFYGLAAGVVTAACGFLSGHPGIGALGIVLTLACLAYGGWREIAECIRWRDQLRAERSAASPAPVILVARPVPPPVVVIAPAPPPLPRPFQFDTPEQMEARFLAFLAKPVAAEKPVIRPAARKPVARMIRVTRTTVTITSQERKG